MDRHAIHVLLGRSGCYLSNFTVPLALGHFVATALAAVLTQINLLTNIPSAVPL
jgi:hypothetical protein